MLLGRVFRRKEQTMSRYVDAEYVKAVMLNDRLMQGNAEFTLYAQQVETQVNALPSIDIIRCRDCKWWDKEVEFCTRVSMCMKADDFCSYGKVSEKPTGSERSSE